jgi:hypothetical protein
MTPTCHVIDSGVRHDLLVICRSSSRRKKKQKKKQNKEGQFNEDVKVIVLTVKLVLSLTGLLLSLGACILSTDSTFQEMLAAQIFNVQHSCRINAAGSPYFSWPFHSNVQEHGALQLKHNCS